MHIIRIDSDSAHPSLEHLNLGPDLRSELIAARDEPRPVVFLVRESDVAELQSCDDLIIDRATKHPARQLSAIILGYDRIPFLRAGYSSAGKLLNGVRTLLHRAREKNDGNLFLIAVSDAVTADLLRRRGALNLTTDADTDPDDAPPPSRNDANAMDARAMIGLLTDLPIPDRLMRDFIGTSAEVRLVRQLIVRAAEKREPVMILGDTGTGKEVVARLIHALGPRSGATFMAVNCGAIPRELFESELFGYERGAHNTAFASKTGLWRVADRGTLFLDEVGDLTSDHQVKILRALDSGEIHPVGATKPIHVDARILVATNRDLFAMVRAGQFREDLYYRLREFMIRTPSLRSHPQDIPALAQMLWSSITRDSSRELSVEVLNALKARSWPGNVRELRATLSSVANLFGTKGIRSEHLRAAQQFEMMSASSDESDIALENVAAHRLHCIRQLRQTDEILRAAQVSMREFLTGNASSSDHVAAAVASTVDRANEQKHRTQQCVSLA